MTTILQLQALLSLSFCWCSYKAWGSLLGQQLSERDIIVACIDYRWCFCNFSHKFHHFFLAIHSVFPSKLGFVCVLHCIVYHSLRCKFRTWSTSWHLSKFDLSYGFWIVSLYMNITPAYIHRHMKVGKISFPVNYFVNLAPSDSCFPVLVVPSKIGYPTVHLLATIFQK